MDNRPKVSICVSVYNDAPYLRAFLDSVLRQSFEYYEIVLADNCSTDNSLEILQEYEKAFPEKVIICRTDVNRGAASGRNLAFQKSQGSYIYYCDSDDLIHPLGLEKMYSEAVQHCADMVYANANDIYTRDNEIIRIAAHPVKKTAKMSSNDEAITSASGPGLWMYLLRRNLVERIIPMPENVILEDQRVLAIVQSYAKRIRFLNFPVYDWFRRDSGSLTVGDPTKELCEDSERAANYAFQNCNKEHLPALQHVFAKRAVDGLVIRWQYYDIYIREIKSYSNWFYKNPYIKEDKALFDRLRGGHALAVQKRILPFIIYIDGFSTTPSQERIEQLKRVVFSEESKITILSTDTCNINENIYVKRALDRGNTEFACGYFALKQIYEHGGVFLHEGIRILAPLGYLKYQNAFFALIDKTTYSDWIFGAPEGNEAIATLLATYTDKWDKDGTYPTLSERIAIVLTGKYGVPMDGRGRPWGKVISTIPPELAAVDTRYGNISKRCAFEHDFSIYAGKMNYVTMPRSTLKLLIDNEVEKQKTEFDNKIQQDKIKAFEKQIKILENRTKNMEREKEELVNSNTWKLMMKIRNLGDTRIGKLMKVPFRGLIRLYKKLKRK